MKYYLFMSCFVLSLLCKAQDFSGYTVSIDSSSGYTALSGATVLSENARWQARYEINPGFSENTFFSSQFGIEANGYLVYNTVKNHALMSFLGFCCKLDSTSAYSRLSYMVTGDPGEKILKVEFKHVGQGNDPKELLNYQVWVRESGVFEIAIGPNSYEKLPGDTLVDTSQVVFIGLINRNMDQNTNGVFISGSPKSPAANVLNQEQPNLACLRTVPKRGYRYIFTPNH